MADASEDVLVHQDAEQPEAGDDEIVDFRFLTSQKLPSRGLKDFEPHGTNLQASTLDASRNAMYDALKQTRFHQREVERAIYDPITGGAWVVRPGGKWAANVGVSRKTPDKGARLWLLPEEALWLIDRGTLDIRWPTKEDEPEDEGLPMSLQGAYAAFVGDGKASGLSMEKYSVYSYLKRAGYIVVRAEANMKNVPQNRIVSTSTSTFWGTFAKLWSGVLIAPHISRGLPTGPLVKPGFYRNYDQIFALLSVIPFHDPRSVGHELEQPSPDHLSVTYHVYKATNTYRKTDPGPPDFYVSVINARQSCLPTEPELDRLLAQTPYHPPPTDQSIYRKLKEGYQDVVLAVVDQGLISFLNVSDAAFGCEKLWGRPPKPPGKGPGAGKYRQRKGR